jgi:predicted DNA-binding protein with PD1-like motif
MQVNEGRIFIGRFPSKSDLLISLTDFCRDNDVRLGVFSVIGALFSAKLGFYRQDEHRYVECLSLKKTLEITSCTGNVSLMDSKIFIHAHVTLADHEGRCYGGHLMPGAVIFAAEYNIRELKGGELKREHDQETGLCLWGQESS